MAAVAPLRPDPVAPSTPRTPLRLAPAAPQRSSARDAVWAMTLALLLAVGIVGVLVLNTSTQTQADRIAATRQHLADLALRAQVLQTQADETAAPGTLAARARALHLRPAAHIGFLQPAPARRVVTSARRVVRGAHPRTRTPVSARVPAARRVRAG